jgi:hypothetical protein
MVATDGVSETIDDMRAIYAARDWPDEEWPEQLLFRNGFIPPISPRREACR